MQKQQTNTSPAPPQQPKPAPALTIEILEPRIAPSVGWGCGPIK